MDIRATNKETRSVPTFIVAGYETTRFFYRLFHHPAFADSGSNQWLHSPSQGGTTRPSYSKYPFSSDSFCETAALLLDRSSFPMRDMVEDAFFASASPGSDCVDLDEENCSNFEVDPLPGTNFKLE
jgi:hypothetical protein